MLHLDLDKARELVSLAIAEKGEDYVYVNERGVSGGACYNVHTDPDGNLTPGCLVGHALYLGGIPLASMGGLRMTSAAGSLLGDLRDEGLLSRSPAAVEWLLDVQLAQDDGKTWGEAVAIADENLADRT